MGHGRGSVDELGSIEEARPDRTVGSAVPRQFSPLADTPPPAENSPVDRQGISLVNALDSIFRDRAFHPVTWLGAHVLDAAGDSSRDAMVQPHSASAKECSLAPSVQLLVTPLCGSTFPLLVSRDISAAALTQRLAERCSLPDSAFWLLLRGRYIVGELEGGWLQRNELVKMVLRAPLRGGTIVKSGYLVKDPVHGGLLSSPRRRFFRLTVHALEWYVDDKPSRSPKGSLQLAGASVDEASDRALAIVSAGRRLVLHGDDLSEWATAIRAQLDDLDEHQPVIQAEDMQIAEETVSAALLTSLQDDVDERQQQVSQAEDVRLAEEAVAVALPAGVQEGVIAAAEAAAPALATEVRDIKVPREIVGKSGYLVKEPDAPHQIAASDCCNALQVLQCCCVLFRRCHFFRLSESSLEWYADDELTKPPEGSMRLAGAHIEASGGTLTILSASNQLVLRGDALNEWEVAIRAQLEKLRDITLPPEMYEVLTAFDDRLVDALAASVIRLSRTEWLLAQPDDFKMPYRQQLEELEQSGALPSPLLSPEEAAALVRQGDRSAGAVTHAWLCPGNPDPKGRRMKLLRQELKSRPNIKGLFFEYAHHSTQTQLSRNVHRPSIPTRILRLRTASPAYTSTHLAPFGRSRKTPPSSSRWM